nr:PREDICTED: tetraspanin-4-like [Paralichthys olivaceus]
MRRSSTDETPYRRSPSLDSKPDSPPFTSGFHRFSGEFEYKRPPFAFGFHTTKGPQTSKGRYAQGKKYVVFYLDLSFIFLLELRRCRMAEGCMMALRYGMVFFNLLFWLGGCGILGVGVWLSVTQGNFATLSSSLPSLSAANLLIAVGTIIMVIGCLGCVGAVKESRPLLLTFFILLLLIFFLEILSIMLFFIYQDQCLFLDQPLLLGFLLMNE